MRLNLKIPKKSIRLMKASVLRDYRGVGKDPSFGVNSQFDLNRVKDRVFNLKKDLKLLTLKNKSVLELGSGSGLFVAYLRKNGVESYGVEPEEGAFKSSKLLLRENNLPNCIKNGFGERIPFKDNYFDIVVSFQVLEHTQDPLKVLEQSRRVLKKGGLIYFVVPNYHSFWEGHYSVPWLPCLNKTFSKIYLKTIGRDEKFIDTLQFVNPEKLRYWTKKLNLTILSLGEERFRRNISKEKIKDYWAGNSLLRKTIELIRRSKLDKILAWIFIKLDFYYPITFIARK